MVELGDSFGFAAVRGLAALFHRYDARNGFQAVAGALGALKIKNATVINRRYSSRQ